VRVKDARQAFVSRMEAQETNDGKPDDAEIIGLSDALSMAPLNETQQTTPAAQIASSGPFRLTGLVLPSDRLVYHCADIFGMFYALCSCFTNVCADGTLLVGHSGGLSAKSLAAGNRSTSYWS